MTLTRATYDGDLAAEVIFDLTRLDCIWRVLGDDAVKLYTRSAQDRKSTEKGNSRLMPILSAVTNDRLQKIPRRMSFNNF